jgi:ABC-type lipoprotein export system ATPase subunit
MGINFSNFFYIKDMSVEDNIIFPAVFANRSKSYISDRLEMLYDSFSNIVLTDKETFNLRKYKDKKIGTMSNGQREIVMLSRMLINDSKYYLADEMLRSFNTKVKKQVWDILINVFKIGSKSSLLMITHDDNMVNYDKITNVYDFDSGRLTERSL